MRMKQRALIAALALLLPIGIAVAQTGNAFDDARAALKTSAKAGPSPQPYDKKTPRGVEVVRYTSSAGEMMAWVLRPAGNDTPPKPVMVFAHGGFALGGGDDEMARPFVDAGFIVMLPALRGENGNPGKYELFLGEVDDVLAAGHKAKTLPGAAPERVYLFGHSVGGGLATLAALSAQSPYRMVGAAGGNYLRESCEDMVEQWSGTFTPTDAECNARFPDAYLSALKTPVYSYAGTADVYATQAGKALKRIASDQYHLMSVKGDHFSSADAAIKDFIAQTRK